RCGGLCWGGFETRPNRSWAILKHQDAAVGVDSGLAVVIGPSVAEVGGGVVLSRRGLLAHAGSGPPGAPRPRARGWGTIAPHPPGGGRILRVDREQRARAPGGLPAGETTDDLVVGAGRAERVAGNRDEHVVCVIVDSDRLAGAVPTDQAAGAAATAYM